MSKIILLSRGKQAIVDDDIYEKLSSLRKKWSYAGLDTRGYAYNYSLGYLHRYILGYPNGVVDHIDGDRLNNRLSNLRVCDQSVNLKNCKLSSRNKSGFQGVSMDSKSGKWTTHISVDGKVISLGFFEDISDAIGARVAGEVEFYQRPQYILYELSKE